jgi:hypothetical protein
MGDLDEAAVREIATSMGATYATAAIALYGSGSFITEDDLREWARVHAVAARDGRR